MLRRSKAASYPKPRLYLKGCKAIIGPLVLALIQRNHEATAFCQNGFNRKIVCLQSVGLPVS